MVYGEKIIQIWIYFYQNLSVFLLFSPECLTLFFQIFWSFTALFEESLSNKLEFWKRQKIPFSSHFYQFDAKRLTRFFHIFQLATALERKRFCKRIFFSKISRLFRKKHKHPIVNSQEEIFIIHDYQVSKSKRVAIICKRSIVISKT